VGSDPVGHLRSPGSGFARFRTQNAHALPRTPRFCVLRKLRAAFTRCLSLSSLNAWLRATRFCALAAQPRHLLGSVNLL